MVRNYLLIAFRSIIKNKGHALVNVFGLALGITCSIVIFLIVRFELSYDNFHPESDRIYRIVTMFTKSDKPGYGSGMTYPLPEALRQDFADLQYVSIVDNNLDDPVITITKDDGSENRFKEKKVVFVDPEYLKIFKHEWIAGNDNSLTAEKTAIITASLARKYFGNEPALNKVINFNNQFDVTITGVIADPPLNTDFSFELILSSRLGKDKRGWEGWGAAASSINCYVKLNKSTTQEDFNSKLKDWHLKYFTGDNEEDGKSRRYFLQPLNDVHTDTRFHNFSHRVVSKVTLLSLSSIGILLLMTACINFINLNTVLIIKRSKEAGVRKTLGSSRSQLIWQFMGETFLISLLALIISAGLSELLLINLQPVLTYRLSFFSMFDGLTIAYLVFLPILVTTLAGIYPAIRLARFQPATTLKGIASYGEGLILRRTLIVFQLFIAQGLVITTIITAKQINHFMSQPLGLNSEAVIEFPLPENKKEFIQTLKERLLTISGVESIAMSNTGATSQSSWGGEFAATVKNDVVKAYTNVKFADEGFLKTYGLNLTYGEGIIPSDTANRFVVNEKFVKTLGFQNPADAIGTPVDMWGKKSVIMGVVKDFNPTPLQFQLSPVIILAGMDSYYVGAVRLNTNDLQNTIRQIQNTWESVYPKYVFEHTFLDDQIDHFYDAEKRNSYIMGFFSVVAIFIGCIGLLGLVSFMVQQKIKEIGIRKTFGASVGQIVGLLSKEFVVLIGISFLLSAPLAYYFMQKWLSNFAYKYSMTGLEFLAGFLLTLIISMLTIGYRSIRAARANPIDALRTE
ncbi:FtsX-like permease family protein [Chryseolinea sp. H1M3-3]|uniref:FtsX-like permease family protein n=1 Tax=Chryseolinea sp. H1M3-3 TaxID=3034144 RepID=UPI0023EC26A2|nr:FtsX-like permease family protein [Chryseolinea sp. H1M3-3]